MGAAKPTEGFPTRYEAVAAMAAAGLSNAQISERLGVSETTISSIRSQGAQRANDLCTRQGAEAVAKRIRAYWRARGYRIQVTLEERGFDPKMRAKSWDVRTNLVDAMPPKAVSPKRIRRAA